MKEQHIRIMLILVAGWMIGFVHHSLAVRPEISALKQERSKIEAKLYEVKALTDTAKRVTVKTTAYSNDPVSINVARWRDERTATNTLARRGVVAADWRVFPPGTRLFIPGYGEAVVEDRGGAIKGLHLDLFVDSVQEAKKWGVQEIPVYVIEKGRKT
ncbi:MAG: 3D domain-containing protein [Thermodesulfovibrionales bacterium]|nr:3D domain-containing protein [Thermodesulfovibrionales bacterium]